MQNEDPLLHLNFYWAGGGCERNDFSKYDIQIYKLVSDKTGSGRDRTKLSSELINLVDLGSVCHNVITVWIGL